MCDSEAPLLAQPYLFAPAIPNAPAIEPEDDFFQFMGDLGIMDVDIPDVSLQNSNDGSSDPISPPPQAKRRSTAKLSAEERVQRIREKNRLAQARFRQKQKVPWLSDHLLSPTF